MRGAPSSLRAAVRAAPNCPPEQAATAEHVMLPARNRVRRSSEFETAVRAGRRAGRPTLVLHLGASGAAGAAPRVGFVVSRAVGGAVVRNRVKRRLRAAAREELAAELGNDAPRGEGSAGGELIVVRATPAAATAPFDALRGDLSVALRQARERAVRRG